MSQVNVNVPPPPSNPPPPRPPSRWPLFAFIAILVVLLLGGLVLAATRRNSQQAAAPATATATPSARSGAGKSTATAPSATSAPAGAGAVTATPAPGAATATSSSGAGGGAGPTATPRPPTNPTAMRVDSGTCTIQRITWTWSGARRATSYDEVIYDPVSANVFRDTSTKGASYTLRTDPGATLALKVRSRNAAGTAPNYFTPRDVGRVPPHTPNPKTMTVSTSGNTLRWAWNAVPGATAYDLVLYHYNGSTPKTDITARSTLAHWNIAVTPGVSYRLKVRPVAQCPPANYFTPSTTARAS